MHDDPFAEEKLGKAIDLKYIRRILKYVGPYWKLVVFVVLMLLVMTAVDLYCPMVIKNAIDDFFPQKNTQSSQGSTDSANTGATESKADTKPSFTDDEKISAITRLGIFLIGLYVLHGLITIVQMYSLVYVGQGVIYDLRRKVFSHLQTLPLSYFDKNPTGRIVTRVTNDTNVINQAFSGVIVYLFQDLFLMTGILIVFFSINATLTLIILAPIPGIIAITMVFRVLHRNAYRWIREAVARVNSFMHESFSGIAVIKMFTREKKVGSEFGKVNEDNYQARFREVVLQSVFGPLIMVMTNIPIALLLWAGGHRILGGYISFGEFYLFVMYLRMFFAPIQDFSEKYIIMQQAMAASERIFHILDNEGGIPDPDEPAKIGDCKGALEFSDVHFSYDGKVDVLKGISFKVAPGETLALVGNTGSGKTTITSLICRFYDVTSGHVLVDGVDVTEYNKYDLRRHIGIVMQDSFLFSEKIKDNIRLASKDISESDVREAARMVGAEEFILEQKDKWDEVLKERGVGLSVGQKQLISFARALAHDREILILDEATASIDTKSEALIQEATRKLLEGRTSVVVAHRLSTIKNADNIIVIDKGEIIEEGNHRELIRRKGAYYRMYMLQFAGDENNTDSQ